MFSFCYVFGPYVFVVDSFFLGLFVRRYVLGLSVSICIRYKVKSFLASRLVISLPFPFRLVVSFILFSVSFLLFCQLLSVMDSPKASELFVC